MPMVKPQAPAAPKSPQEQFDSAFTMLRNNDYDNGGKAMQGFADKYPNDPLTGSALYWVGRSWYGQEEYEKAARSFYDSYKRFPKSPKAPESLLSVGLSMSALGKKKEACAVLQTFKTEFPEAQDALKRQATAERQRLSCAP